MQSTKTAPRAQAAPVVSPVVSAVQPAPGHYQIEKLYLTARGAFSFIVTHPNGKQSCVDERPLGRFTNYYSSTGAYGQLCQNGDVNIYSAANIPGDGDDVTVVIAFVKQEEARQIAEFRDSSRPNFSEAFPEKRKAWVEALGQMFAAANAAGLDTKNADAMREAIRISLGVGIQSRKQLTINELHLMTGSFAAGEWLPGWIHCPDALLA